MEAGGTHIAGRIAAPGRRSTLITHGCTYHRRTARRGVGRRPSAPVRAASAHGLAGISLARTVTIFSISQGKLDRLPVFGRKEKEVRASPKKRIETAGRVGAVPGGRRYAEDLERSRGCNAGGWRRRGTASPRDRALAQAGRPEHARNATSSRTFARAGSGCSRRSYHATSGQAGAAGARGPCPCRRAGLRLQQARRRLPAPHRTLFLLPRPHLDLHPRSLPALQPATTPLSLFSPSRSHRRAAPRIPADQEELLVGQPARRDRACSPCPRGPTPASTIDRGRQPLSQCTAASFGHGLSQWLPHCLHDRPSPRNGPRPFLSSFSTSIPTSKLAAAPRRSTSSRQVSSNLTGSSSSPKTAR